MRLYETDEPAWYGTQADAKASGRPFVMRKVPTDKPGLLKWLNSNAVSADPVIADIRREPDTSDIPIATPKWFESASLTITDEAFDKFPLARQLHFAALAMENARACLKGEAA